jgi:hypothetical protein
MPILIEMVQEIAASAELLISLGILDVRSSEAGDR